MTTRDLIQTIRDCKTGNDGFNALLEECASRIEDYMGGPLEDHFNYSDYTVTVKTDPSFYGDDTTDEEAEEMSSSLTESLKVRFPGINVRQCAKIGIGRQDATAGPDEKICALIDRVSFETIRKWN